MTTPTINDMIPEGWRFFSAEFRGIASEIRDTGTVVLMRTVEDRMKWDNLPEHLRTTTDLYKTGEGLTIEQAVAHAVAQITESDDIDKILNQSVYKPGDVFKIHNEHYILAVTGQEGEVLLINLATGNRYAGPMTFSGSVWQGIQQSDFERLFVKTSSFAKKIEKVLDAGCLTVTE